jgi:hypothetical protein
MAVLPYEETEEEKELSESWSDKFVSGALVLKDLTEYNKNSKIKIIKAGTVSHGYKHCYFHFKSEDGEDLSINVFQVSRNEGTYFQKIEKEKAIFKFNNASGALICSECRVILKTGNLFSEQEKKAMRGEIYLEPQYCKECKQKNIKNDN